MKSWKRDYLELPDFLVALASMFTRIHPSGIDDLISEFHNYAGRHPYIDDVDVGAVVLQLSVNKIDDISLKKRLLHEAINRAKWCVRAAGSSGETIARKVHLFELESQLDQYPGCSVCRVHDGKFETEENFISVKRRVSELAQSDELKKIEGLSNDRCFYEENYRCSQCGQDWILSHPDQAYRGGWKVRERVV